MSLPWFVEAGSGIPVVAVHGAIADYRFFEPQLESLSKRRRLVAPSLGGYHPRPFDAAGFSAGHHVDEIISLLRHVGPGHLIGHSRGGRLALYAAARAPELVRSLVLVDPGGVTTPDFLPTTTPPPVHPPAEAQVATSAAEAVELYVDAIFGKGAWRGTPALFQRMTEANAATMDASGSDHTLPLAREIARQVPMPTLLIEGADSPPRFHAICATLAGCIPHARRLRIEGRDHFLTMKDPDAFNALIEDFFDEVEVSVSAP